MFSLVENIIEKFILLINNKWRQNRILEITGKRYGQLVVLTCWYEKIPSGKQNILICECICDCGNICITRHNSLTTGNTTSCGDCILYKHIGHKYNKLTITKAYREERRVFCTCVCECGTICEHIDIQNVVSGAKKSCGCIPHGTPWDFTGKVYNGNTAIKYIKQTPGGALWLWRCGNCGKPFECIIGKITTGHTTSCGCLTESKGVSKIKKILDENSIKYKTEYTLDNLINPKTGYKLRFDFWIPEKGYAIEFDGKQHFCVGTYSKDEKDLKEVQYRDELKNIYCKNNNIILIRIPYTDLNSIAIEDLVIGSKYTVN